MADMMELVNKDFKIAIMYRIAYGLKKILNMKRRKMNYIYI